MTLQQTHFFTRAYYAQVKNYSFLSSADLTGANLLGANVSGAVLNYARLNEALISDEQLGTVKSRLER